MLEEIRRVLTDDGRLILSVPNSMSLRNVWKHFRGKYDSIIADKSAHIAFFDYGSLQKLLGMAGFHALAVYTPYFGLPKLKRLLGWKKMRALLGRKFPQFGEQIMVIAEKRPSNFFDLLK